MQTLKNTPYQTLQANTKKLAELAAWYATTAAAETLEAGRQTEQAKAQAHTNAATDLSTGARRLQTMACDLERYLEARRSEEVRPAIEKAAR